MDFKKGFRGIAENYKQRLENPKSPLDNQPDQENSQNSQAPSTSPTTEEAELIKKKKGRPPHGKRSNPDWVGRTYYIEKTVDLDVAEQLLLLKREGKDVDKSELVNFLLSEWTKYQQGEKATFQIGENTKI